MDKAISSIVRPLKASSLYTKYLCFVLGLQTGYIERNWQWKIFIKLVYISISRETKKQRGLQTERERALQKRIKVRSYVHYISARLNVKAVKRLKTYARTTKLTSPPRRNKSKEQPCGNPTFTHHTSDGKILLYHIVHCCTKQVHDFKCSNQFFVLFLVLRWLAFF